MPYLRRRSNPDEPDPAAPRKRKITPEWQLVIWSGLGVCLLAIAGFVIARSTPVAAPRDLHSELRSAAYRGVRARIRRELRTTFSEAPETRVEPLPNGQYLVSGWVDLVAESGEGERDAFSCRLGRNGAGDWTAEEVTVVPQ